VEQTWLRQYPWPAIVVIDKDAEFIGHFVQMVAKDYGIEWNGMEYPYKVPKPMQL
jgi:hypothetical protein